MNEIIRLETLEDYCGPLGLEVMHPLVTVADFSKIEVLPHFRHNYGFYAVFSKELNCGELSYGRGVYDYQEGTFVFFAPGQVAGVDDGGVTKNPKARVLLFHPDLIYGTSLAKRMKEYSFFLYDSDESLHVSEQERRLILDGFDRIEAELTRPDGQFDKRRIADIIRSVLDYCKHFYDRQFITRKRPNTDILAKFERLLNDYFYSDKPRRIGLPTVSYFADELCLSPNYFGDLVKRETGMSPQEYIQRSVVEQIKRELTESERTISEIAFKLGFKYPQHLSRTFKTMTGVSPREYKAKNSLNNK